MENPPTSELFSETNVKIYQSINKIATDKQVQYGRMANAREE